MSVLILTEIESDAHLPPVARELSRRGVEFSIFDPGNFPSSVTITTESTEDGVRSVVAWEGRELDLASVHSVWHRRPTRFTAPEGLLPEEAEWLETETRQFLSGIWSTTDALWVSDLEAQRRAGFKLLQLPLARQLGFAVPPYLATNDPARALGFIDAHPGGVVVKALGIPGIDIPGQGAGSIYTHPVTEEDLDYLDSVRHGPTFFQAFVRKRRDVRVTVVGDRLFAAGIESAGDPLTAIDFRHGETWNLPHNPLTLPASIERGCLELVRRLGLQFGAIDLLETSDGDYVFLEINPNGQWLWIEAMTGQPIAAAMADLLEAGLRGVATKPKAAPPRERHTLPIGSHTVPIPEHAGQAMSANGDETLNLYGTRVWLERKRGNLLLHMGDTANDSERL